MKLCDSQQKVEHSQAASKWVQPVQGLAQLCPWQQGCHENIEGHNTGAMDESIPSIYIPVEDGKVVAINQEDLPEVEDIIELLRGFSSDLDPWVQVVKMYLAQVNISPASI